MNGLKSVPQVSDLIQAYREIQDISKDPSLDSIVLWSQWARLDPRLAELWVNWIARSWTKLPAGQISELLSQQVWPSSFALLLEHVTTFLITDSKEKRRFKLWAKSITDGVLPASHELYFIGTSSFAGKQTLAQAEDSIRVYLKWGYFGKDPLVNKSQSKIKTSGQTLLAPEYRRRALAKLLIKRERITVSDYLEALGGGASRRQAELDLMIYPGLKAVGNTRARFYRRSKSGR